MTDEMLTQPVDVGTALKRMEGDEELFHDLLNLFADHIPTMLSDIQLAVASADAEKLRVAAHSLKGAASNVCAEPVRNAAERLEIMAKSSDFKEVESTVAELEKNVNWLCDYVSKMQDEQAGDNDASA